MTSNPLGGTDKTIKDTQPLAGFVAGNRVTEDPENLGSFVLSSRVSIETKTAASSNSAVRISQQLQRINVFLENSENLKSLVPDSARQKLYWISKKIEGAIDVDDSEFVGWLSNVLRQIERELSGVLSTEFRLEPKFELARDAGAFAIADRRLVNIVKIVELLNHRSRQSQVLNDAMRLKFGGQSSQASPSRLDDLEVFFTDNGEILFSNLQEGDLPVYDTKETTFEELSENSGVLERVFKKPEKSRALEVHDEVSTQRYGYLFNLNPGQILKLEKEKLWCQVRMLNSHCFSYAGIIFLNDSGDLVRASKGMINGVFDEIHQAASKLAKANMSEYVPKFIEQYRELRATKEAINKDGITSRGEVDAYYGKVITLAKDFGEVANLVFTKSVHDEGISSSLASEGKDLPEAALAAAKELNSLVGEGVSTSRSITAGVDSETNNVLRYLGQMLASLRDRISF